MDKPLRPQYECKNATAFSFVPPVAGQGWKLEMFELLEQTEPHYHLLQKEWIVVTEGALTVLNKDQSIPLTSGQSTVIKPGDVHSIVPIGKVCFFAISLPGFNDPEDVYRDETHSSTPNLSTSIHRDFFPPLDPKYFGPKLERQGTYWVYDLVTGSMTGGKWSVALIEIQDSPKHFHRIESEHFIVVNGILEIEIDQVRHILGPGEAIHIAPGMVHQLKSANENPVRVLCFSFPAFDPSDKNHIH